MYWLVRKNNDGSVNILDTEDFEIDTFTMDELACYLDRGVEVIGARRNMFMGGQIVTVVKKLYCLCDIGSTYASLVSLDGKEKKTIIFTGKQMNKIRDESDADLLESLIDDGVLINVWDNNSSFTKDLFRGKEIEVKKQRNDYWGSIETYEKKIKYFKAIVSINRRRYEMYTTDEYKVRTSYRILLNSCDIFKLGKEDLDYSRYHILEDGHTDYNVNVYDSVEDEIVTLNTDEVRKEIAEGYGFRGISFSNIGFFRYDGNFYDNVLHEIRDRQKQRADNINEKLSEIVSSDDTKMKEKTKYTYKGIFRNEWFNYYDNEKEVDMQVDIGSEDRLFGIITMENFGSSLPIILEDLSKAIIRLEAKGKLSGANFDLRIKEIESIRKGIIRNNIGVFEYSDAKKYIYFNNWQYTKSLYDVDALKSGGYYHTDYVDISDTGEMVVSIISDKYTFNIGITNSEIDWFDRNIGLIKPGLHFKVGHGMDNRELPITSANSMSEYYIKYASMIIGKKYGIPVPLEDKKVKEPLEYISLMARTIEDFGSIPLAVVGFEITGFNVKLIQLCIEMSVTWLDVINGKKVPLIKSCNIYLDYVDKNNALTVDIVKDEVNYVLVEIGQSSLTIPKVIWEVN